MSILDYVLLPCEDEIGKYDTIINFAYSLKIRMESLEILNNSFPEITIELLSHLQSMYLFSESKIIEEFLIEIVLSLPISGYNKIEIVKTLINYSTNNKIGYETLNKVIKKVDTLSIPYIVESILILSKCEEYYEDAKNYFCKLINNQDIDCFYRYKILLSLENLNKTQDFIESACLSFINTDNNLITYKILCCQLILQKYESNLRKEIENYLYAFASDEDLAHEIRADAADTLLHLGSESNKELAREIILILGENKGSIYSDNENVHRLAIEESANEILEHLNNINNNIEINFDTVRSKIENIIKFYKSTEGTCCICLCDELDNELKLYKTSCEHIYHPECLAKWSKFKTECPTCRKELNFDGPFYKFDEEKLINIKVDEKEKDKIIISLDRISVDRALYSKYNMSVSRNINSSMEIYY